jgi:hypothetical protein
MQTPRQYMPIIFEAVLEKFGTYLPFNTKYAQELKFTVEDESIPMDKRIKMCKAAGQNVCDKVPLPEGVKLTGCNIRVLEEY